MRHLFIPFAVIALNEDGQIQDEEALVDYGIDNYRKMTGVYKGHREFSYLIPTTSEWLEHKIKSIANIHGQESVLFVRNDRSAYLYMLRTGQTVELGQWMEVDENTAERVGAYTHDTKTNKFYTCI